MAEDSAPVDIFRDTPVRLLGYANEVGEAFRSLTPPWFVRGSYGVASLYVLADTYDKANKMRQTPGATATATLHSALDTLLWQALASVIVPGFTINRVCAASLFTLARVAPSLPGPARKWATTGLGLATIPFIVAPIDAGVHWAMDRAVRPHLQLEGAKREE